MNLRILGAPNRGLHDEENNERENGIKICPFDTVLLVLFKGLGIAGTEYDPIVVPTLGSILLYTGVVYSQFFF